MKFTKIYAQQQPIISVELFPPKTERGWTNLYNRLDVLQQYPLDFVTITYGAGGSTQARTLELVQEVKEKAQTISLPHFTSIGASRNSVQAFVDDAIAQGVENIVALRGDKPQNNATFKPSPDGFQYANELVTFIRSHTSALDIAVGGYPEGHPESPDLKTDIVNLKRKVSAGANLIITQLFYENSHFFRFRDLATQAGITVPIVPGILPITKLSQIERITALCGATIPTNLYTALAQYDDGSEAQRNIGINHAIQQIQELLNEGAPGIHIYSLNHWQTVSGLIEGIADYLPSS